MNKNNQRNVDYPKQGITWLRQQMMKATSMLIRQFVFIALIGLSVQVTRAAEPFQKESKKVAKILKDEGWKVFGDGKTIKEALDAHYQALGESNGNLMPIEGRAKAKNVNLALKKSQNYATQQYASMRETKVDGTVGMDINTTSGDEGATQTTLNVNYLSSTQQVVKALSPSAVFYRTLNDGWIEVRAFFLVDTLK